MSNPTDETIRKLYDSITADIAAVHGPKPCPPRGVSRIYDYLAGRSEESAGVVLALAMEVKRISQKYRLDHLGRRS